MFTQYMFKTVNILEFTVRGIKMIQVKTVNVKKIKYLLKKISCLLYTHI